MLPIKIGFPEHFLEEEKRSGYTVSAEMKKIWLVELDLLNEFIRVCDKYGLKYYAAGGTILGAVRHQGFIPWDDDIDLMMFRSEYNRLCEIASSEFSHPYFFQTEETDPGSFRGHAQLRNSETTGMLNHEYGKIDSINMGIFIDIFPLDNVPDEETERKKLFTELTRKRNLPRLLVKALYSYKFQFRRNVLKLLVEFLKLYYFKVFFTKQQILVKCKTSYLEYEKSAVAYNNCHSSKVVLTPIYRERFVMDKKDLTALEYVPFEMLKLPIPLGYENILNHTYGNWRKFVVGTSEHGGVFFDPDKPYTKYLKNNK